MSAHDKDQLDEWMYRSFLKKMPKNFNLLGGDATLYHHVSPKTSKLQEN